MKPVLSFLLLSALFLCSCNEKGAKDPLEPSLSKTEAKKDFMLFRKILQSSHPSLSIYMGRQKTDFLFDSVYNSFSGPLSFRAFFNSLFFLTNEVGCSHTDVSLPDDIYDTLQNRKFFFPYPVLWVENKLLINVTGYDLPEGTQILSINGKPSDLILAGLSVYNAVEGFHRPSQLNMAAKDFSFQYYLKWGPEQKFDLKIRDTLGKSKTVSAEPITYGEWNNRNEYGKYYFDGTDVDYDLTVYNKKGYAIIRLPTFKFYGYQKQTAFENFCANSFELLKRKKNITRLIIDIRENGGGRLYGAFLLFSYLARKPYVEYDHVYSRINQVPYSEYLDKEFANNEKAELIKDLHDEFKKRENGYYYYADSLIKKWIPDDNRFQGQIFVITNSANVSSASYFALMVKYSGIGKIAGDETAGGSYSGNGFKTLTYALPLSRIKFNFAFAHLAYSFKEVKNTGRGLIPDYLIPDTYESFKKNEDRQILYIKDSLFLN
jgi:hypothetical protein